MTRVRLNSSTIADSLTSLNFLSFSGQRKVILSSSSRHLLMVSSLAETSFSWLSGRYTISKPFFGVSVPGVSFGSWRASANRAATPFFTKIASRTPFQYEDIFEAVRRSSRGRKIGFCIPARKEVLRFLCLRFEEAPFLVVSVRPPRDYEPLFFQVEEELHPIREEWRLRNSSFAEVLVYGGREGPRPFARVEFIPAGQYPSRSGPVWGGSSPPPW